LAFYHAGQYDQAIEQLKKTLEMDPSFPPAQHFLAAAYLQKKGMYPEAIIGFQKAIRLTRGRARSGSMAGLGHVYVSVWEEKRSAQGAQ
jgi:tetratricopeptide (TPR) repeat protein